MHPVRTFHADGGGVAWQRRLLPGEKLRRGTLRVRAVCSQACKSDMVFVLCVRPAGRVVAPMLWHCWSAGQSQGALGCEDVRVDTCSVRFNFSCTLARSACFCLQACEARLLDVPHDLT